MKYTKDILIAFCIIFVTIFFYKYISNPFLMAEENIFGFVLHNVNLIFHEAGHPILSIFGIDTLTYLGGSLFQILIPTIFIFYFLSKKQFGSMGGVLMWLSINISEIAIYVGDAIDMQLPLLGQIDSADTSGHDWNNILSNFGILRYAPRLQNTLLDISNIILFIGFTLLLYPVIFQIYQKYLNK